jgi:hypothetical protein
VHDHYEDAVMLNIAVAESPQPSVRIAAVMREFVAWFEARGAADNCAAGTQSRPSAVWTTLVLTIAWVSAAVSPPGPGGFEMSHASVFPAAAQRQVVDDVWCNHVVTVDSQGFTDKVLDCRTMAAWRAAMVPVPPLSGELLASAP